MNFPKNHVRLEDVQEGASYLANIRYKWTLVKAVCRLNNGQFLVETYDDIPALYCKPYTDLDYVARVDTTS